MKPIDFIESNKVHGGVGFNPLPVYEMDGIVVSCWRISFRELLRLIWTRKIWHGQITQGYHPQPIHQSVRKREVIIEKK